MPIAPLILQAALQWGVPVAMKIADIWKGGKLTDAEAVDALTGILVEINSKTVDSAIAEAEARAAGH